LTAKDNLLKNAKEVLSLNKFQGHKQTCFQENIIFTWSDWFCFERRKYGGRREKETRLRLVVSRIKVNIWLSSKNVEELCLFPIPQKQQTLNTFF
jgi:hypothetical protein